MAQIQAMGDGPIVFFTNKGMRVEVPLVDIYFENGKVNTKRTNDAVSADLLAWLRYLAAEGRLTPGAAPALAPAVIFTAANPGAPGNRIQVIVAAKTATTVDLTVTSTDRYTGLTLATIEQTLGTGTAAGTQPGLLLVSKNQAAAPPSVNGDINGTGAAPSWRIAGTAALGTVLEPRYPGTGLTAANTTVTLGDITAAAPTFTLTVVWTTNLIPDVTVNDFIAGTGANKKLAPLAPLVKIGPPTGGYALPRAGTIALSGGSEAAAAVPAATTALASA